MLFVITHYTVAAVQFEPRFGDKEWNVSRLLHLAAEAADSGARLIVLPEMGTTGYCFRSRQEIAPLVEPVPGGPTLTAFADLAASRGVYLVIGLPEVDPTTGFYYNTAALVGPRGFVGKYRKIHSYVDEVRWAKDGDLGMPVFPTELGCIAMQICMDADFMEPARLAALAGAEILAFPTNWEGEPTTWFARSRENGLYTIAANRWGEERGERFCGNSAVIDPRGMALSHLGQGDGLCLAQVDLEQARAARKKALAARRPAQYHDLVLNSYLWGWQKTHQLPAGRRVVVAVGTATEPQAMGQQARWADLRARDHGWPKLDLMLFPACQTDAVAELQATATALQCHIVWAQAGTAWLMGPDGTCDHYQAVHPHQGEQPGAEGFACVDLPWGRLGLAAGVDLNLPETARILAKRGADLIVAPLAEAEEEDRLLWRARWLENEAAVAVATPNRAGALFGARQQIAPGGDGILIGGVETDAEQIRGKELLRKLQPFWYGPLVTSPVDR